MNITLNKNNILNIVFLTLFVYLILVLINKKYNNNILNKLYNQDNTNNKDNIEGFNDNTSDCNDRYRYWSKLTNKNTIKEYEKKYKNCFTKDKKDNFRNKIKKSIEILNNFDITNEDLCEQVKEQLNYQVPNPNARKLILDSFKCSNNIIENFQEKETLTDEDLLQANNISNFSINEYKRWLLLHKSTMDKLTKEHLNNLKTLINNKNLKMKDLPKNMEIDDPRVYKKKSLDDLVTFKQQNAKLDNNENIDKFYSNLDGVSIQSDYVNNFSKYPKYEKIKLYMKENNNKNKKNAYELDEYLVQQDKNRHKKLNKKQKVKKLKTKKPKTKTKSK